MRAWRKETDIDIHFISDWESREAVIADSHNMTIGIVDEDLDIFDEATRGRHPEVIRFNQFLAAHNCNIYNHDPNLTFDEDFANCATAWAWLPGTEAYEVFRIRALAAERCARVD